MFNPLPVHLRRTVSGIRRHAGMENECRERSREQENESEPFSVEYEIDQTQERGGLRVMIDDRRGVSPGVKFNDSELIGVPLVVVVGKKLAEGAIEVKDRASGQRQDVALGDAVATISELVQALP